ncbi:hypothetical protein BD408DRAFT_419463 [Parasitella parasitica]|nr:hypothetical protein BD408DRAFT_419463 [Parasitella parasitica]
MDTLPNEILSAIFNQVGLESIVKLAECRLVSSLWDQLSAQVLFSQTVDLRTNGQIAKFNYHLARKPALAHFIQSIHLSDLNPPLSFQREFLSLALTPNIRYLTGEVNEELFSCLLDVAKRSAKAGEKFSKLQVLPELSLREPFGPRVFLTVQDVSTSLMHVKQSLLHTKYFHIAFHFKESLRELSISQFPDPTKTMKTFFAHLNEFKSLTNLTLNFFDVFPGDQCHGFLELDKTLNKCEHLQFLRLRWYSADERSMGTAEFQEWLSSNVMKVPGPLKLELAGVSISHVTEYLVHKYPNISSVRLSSLTLREVRVMNAIAHIDREL